MLKQKALNILPIVVIILIGLSYLFGLFIDLTGDSGLYAAISKQMVESGDWFNLKINGEIYDQKPHLLFWLSGLGIQLFGNTNFAFKLFPVLFGFFGFYFTYKLAEFLFSKETGKLALLITASSQLIFLYFLDIHTDTILQTGVTLAMWQLAVYLKKNKPVNFIFGFFGIGLAMFSKGPVGAVLPFFGVLLYLIVQKNWTQLFSLKWLLGIGIVLLVISPTLIHLYSGFGWKGIKFYFITNNFGRISGEYAGSSSDPLFYIHTLLWAFLPWTVFVVSALIFEIKNFIKTPTAWKVYLLGSSLVLLTILSIAKGKSPNYFLIAVPLLSVVTASHINYLKNSKGKHLKNILSIQKVLILFLLVIFIGAALIFSNNYLIAVLLVFPAILATSLLFFKFKSSLKFTIYSSVIVACSLNLLLISDLIPQLFRYQGARQALKIYEEERDEKDILLNLHISELELFYYANSPVQQFTNWEDFYDFFEKEGAWIYTNKPGYEGILDLNHTIDTVYTIRQRGMNDLSISFLNPSTRENELNENYLIKVH